MVVVGAAVIVFVVGIANFALGQVGLGVAAVSIGLLVFGAGLSWLAMERRRIREAEREWPPY
nr:LapA family protein [Mycobacterium sp. 852002-51163_SCH5372311]